MHVVLAGPLGTDLLREASGLPFSGAPAGQGGPIAAFLAAGLIARGVRVTIVTLEPGDTQRSTFAENGITVHFCPMRLRQRHRALDLFRMEIEVLEAVLREVNGDVVNAHWTYEYAEAAVRSGLPHLITMHDLGWDNLWLYRNAYRLFRLIAKLRVMPRVRNLSVVAPFMVKNARHYGYFGPVTVIPNGILVPPFYPDKVGSRLSRAPCLVTIGDLSRRKNVRASIQAFQLIRERFPDAELHLFGPGLDEEHVKGETGVNGHGAVPHSDLMQFLDANATLLVHPSRQETFGLIVAEAKVRGIPVVGGLRSGGVAFVCGENAGCRLVDVTKPTAIAAAAIDLLSDPRQYAIDATRARADVEARFENSTITEQYFAVYEKITAAFRPAASGRQLTTKA